MNPRVFLALHDQSVPGPDGNYWTWRHPNLPPEFLARFYHEVIVPHRLRLGRIDEAGAPVAIGGGGVIDDSWAGVYRCFPAGRDAHGRPGRVVTLCAFADLAEAAQIDWAHLLDAGWWEEIGSASAARLPSPAPASLAQTPRTSARLHGVSSLARFHTGTNSRAWFAALLPQPDGPKPWRGEWTETPDGGAGQWSPLRVDAPGELPVIAASPKQARSTGPWLSAPASAAHATSPAPANGSCRKWSPLIIAFALGLLLGGAAGGYYRGKPTAKSEDPPAETPGNGATPGQPDGAKAPDRNQNGPAGK